MSMIHGIPDSALLVAETGDVFSVKTKRFLAESPVMARVSVGDAARMRVLEMRCDRGFGEDLWTVCGEAYTKEVA